MTSPEPRQRFGPYEAVQLIGAGGMGEVWKARDTRLDRTVALKTPKQQFSERFEQEARAAAALNRPNVCQLYDVGPNYLVMEFIEGLEPDPGRAGCSAWQRDHSSRKKARIDLPSAVTAV